MVHNILSFPLKNFSGRFYISYYFIIIILLYYYIQFKKSPILTQVINYSCGCYFQLSIRKING